MADPQRRPDLDLIDQLFAEPYRFDFFQAVRLLERLAPGRVPVGQDGPFDREVARFAQHLTLAFPPSAVHSLERAYGPRSQRPAQRPEEPGDKPPRMVTSFMGLVGPMGALPLVYTEEVVGSGARRRGTAVDFFDLFHHRLVSFFYRAWEKYNVPALWEKGARPGAAVRPGNDPFSTHIFDLLGLGLPSLREGQPYLDASLLSYVGLFAQQHRSAVMLGRLLRDYFGFPVTVLSFSGQWLRLEPDQRSRAGRTGAFNALGRDLVVGRKAWDVQSKFRIRIGPLTYRQFRELAPGGETAERLIHLVRFYVRGELDFDVQLVLRADKVPRSRLKRAGPIPPQLGRNTWLKSRKFARDADDAVFRPRV